MPQWYDSIVLVGVESILGCVWDSTYYGEIVWKKKPRASQKDEMLD